MFKSFLYTVLLFTKNSSKGIVFPSNLFPNGINLRRFVSKYTGILYSTPGDVGGLGTLALEFMIATSNNNLAEKERIIDKANLELNNASLNDDQKTMIQEYIRIMEKVKELGSDYIDSEIKRLSEIIAKGSMSETKKESLLLKRNILYHFDYSVDHLSKQQSDNANEKNEL